MFREIELPTFQAEALLENYLLRATIQPRGDFLTYLNDRGWPTISFQDVELLPLAKERRVGAIKQDLVTINKSHLCMLSLPDAEQTKDIQLQVTKRAVVFYFVNFAIQGQLHIRPDAPDEDLMDEMHDFFAVSEASVFPLWPVASTPISRVPLLFVNRPQIQAYHVSKTDS